MSLDSEMAECEYSTTTPPTGLEVTGAPNVDADGASTFIRKENQRKAEEQAKQQTKGDGVVREMSVRL